MSKGKELTTMLFAAPEPTDHEIEIIQAIEEHRVNLAYALRQPKRWTGLLSRNTLAKAIQGSNSIEGYNVTIDDAVAAVEGEEPLEPKDEAWMAVTGYRAAMTLVLQKAQDHFFSFSPELLKSLHFIMVGYDLSKNPGLWRPGPIFVRDESTGERVYEGPAVEQAVPLIDELLDGLNGADKKGMPDFRGAAMAHLNLVMIHPFSDGNGRMARCLQTLVLARSGITDSIFSSIEEYLGRNRRQYYDVLAKVGHGSWHPDRDAQPWIRFCLTAHYRQAMTLLKRSREIQKLCDELEIMIKRIGLPERSVLALADAAMGYKIRNPTYRNAADVTQVVAGRDLLLLAKANLLEPHGEKRGRYYVAAPSILEIRRRVAEPKRIPDPFSLPENPSLPGMEGLVR